MRKEILEDAIAVTCGDREEDYGSPVINLGNTAELWSAYLRTKYFSKYPGYENLGGEFILTAEDVAWLNLLQKISRSFKAPKKDTYLDAAAYAAIAGECRFSEDEELVSSLKSLMEEYSNDE